MLATGKLWNRSGGYVASAGMCLSETLDANEKRRPDWDAFNVFSTIVFAG